MKRKKAKKPLKTVESLSHAKAKRKNIPAAQHQPFMSEEQRKPKQVRYPRPGAEDFEALRASAKERDEDLDPQLIWEGKEKTNAADLLANAPPIYVQEKVSPKMLVEDLIRFSRQECAERKPERTANLFGEDAKMPSAAKMEFYRHFEGWRNRMILGDSLQVMSSLSDREGMAGKVQCVYFDPPYGIKFNSNFQWTTTSRAIKDGDAKQITRQPEQVKAFRDTWARGIHSYLDYLRDRFTACRELLAESGSIFVQIGDENVHRIRSLLDEVFDSKNCVSIITFRKNVLLFQTKVGHSEKQIDRFVLSLYRLPETEIIFKRKIKC